MDHKEGADTVLSGENKLVPTQGNGIKARILYRELLKKGTNKKGDSLWVKKLYD